MGKVIKKLIIFFTIILGITIFANDEGKAPNEIIKDNPDREVTTVESMKTREHATMSLSVTKVVPEEIMGSLKDGKLSVFISKNKKQPRKADKSMINSDGVDVSKFKLQAYSNPKSQQPMLLKMDMTPEDIRNMMNTTSKEKKINVVENTDEYVRLEVEDVTEDEKVYISIMNGDKVVKSYRIGEISPEPRDWNYCWGPNVNSSSKVSAASITETKVVNFTNKDGKFDFYGTNDSKYQFRIFESEKHSKINRAYVLQPKPTIYLNDDFLHYAHGSDFTIALHLVKSTNLKEPSHYKAKTDAFKEFDGTFAEIEKANTLPNPGEEGFDNYLRFQRGINSEGESYVIANSIWFQTLHYIQQYNTSPVEGNICPQTDTLTGCFRGKIDNVAFRLWINGSMKPGRYNPVTLEAVLKKKDNTTYATPTATITYINQDTTVRIFSKSEKSGKDIPVIIDDNTTYNDYSLSFVNKNKINNEGLFRGNGDQLTPKKKNNDTWECDPFEIASGKNKANVVVSQKQNRYISITLTPTVLDSTTTFEFTLVQKAYANNKSIDLRKVTYKITCEKTNSLGSITYDVDSRIEGTNGEWITTQGQVKTIKGEVMATLPEFVAVTGSFNSPSNRTINSVENINGKERNQLGDKGNYKYLLDEDKNKFALPYNVSSSVYSTGSNSKITINKEDLDSLSKSVKASSLVISKTNAFIVKDNSSTFWSGSVTENYYGNKNPVTNSGEIDMSPATANVEYVFAPGETNPKSKGNGNDPELTLNTGTTVSLDGRGRLTKNSGKSIITKLIVKDYQGKNPQTITGNAQQKINPTNITQLGNTIAIGISDKGGIILKKVGSGNFPDGKKVSIEYYYEGIKLGTFDLVVKLKEDTVQLGEATFTIDHRLIRNKSVKQNYIVFANGGVISGTSASSFAGKYPELIKTSNFSNTTTTTTKIKDITITGMANINLNKTFEGIKYQGFGKQNATQKFLRVFFPFEISIDDLSKHISYHTNPGNLGDFYEFMVTGEDGKKYKGKVKKSLTNSYIESSASLNLTKVPKNVFDIWKSNTNVSLGTLGNMVLEFNSGNSLFKMEGVNTNKIVNKFKYNLNSTGLKLNDSTSLSFDLNNNNTNDVEISFTNDGFQIKKLTNEEITQATLVIEPHYKDIPLGKINLTITNTATDLGDISFEVDSRIGQIKTGDWIAPDGTLFGASGEVAKYPLLVKATDTVSVTNGTHKVKDVESIGDKFEGLGEQNGSRATYKHSANGNNVIALPFTKGGKNVTLGQYDVAHNTSLITISKKDLETVKQMRAPITNNFTITSTDGATKPIDTLYKGTIKETYVGSGAYSGSGKVYIAQAGIGTKYIFSTSISNSTITSNGDLVITNAYGTPVNTNGLVGTTKDKNIANKIKVDFSTTSKGQLKAYGMKAGNFLEATQDGLTLGIDTATGGLTLTKTDFTSVKEANIKYYYDPDTTSQEPSTNAVLLGEFTLNIDDPVFEIDGDGVLNFGDMVYNSNYPYVTQGGLFQVRCNNPSAIENKSVIFSVDKEKVQPMKNTNGQNGDQNEIPLINTEVQTRSNSKFYLQSTADMSKKPNTGRYEGEIEVTVTITDKN